MLEASKCPAKTIFIGQQKTEYSRSPEKMLYTFFTTILFKCLNFIIVPWWTIFFFFAWGL